MSFLALTPGSGSCALTRVVGFGARARSARYVRGAVVARRGPCTAGAGRSSSAGQSSRAMQGPLEPPKPASVVPTPSSTWCWQLSPESHPWSFLDGRALGAVCGQQRVEAPTSPRCQRHQSQGRVISCAEHAALSGTRCRVHRAISGSDTETALHPPASCSPTTPCIRRHRGSMPSNGGTPRVPRPSGERTAGGLRQRRSLGRSPQVGMHTREWCRQAERSTHSPPRSSAARPAGGTGSTHLWW